MEVASTSRLLSVDPGRVGVWTFDFDHQSAARIREQIAELDQSGFGAIWIPEVNDGREAFSLASLLLAESSRIVVATGIARIRDRSARGAVSAQRLLDDAYPGRFILGLGGAPPVTQPVQAMRAYLDEMDGISLAAPSSDPPGPRLLAGYGPAMLRLAGERTAGAHTYKVTVAHTAETRALIGPDRFLAVEHAVLFETDPGRARQMARDHLRTYLASPANVAKFRRLGYSDGDLDAGGSDRFVDDLVAWGDTQTITSQVLAHLEAGADHVAIQVIGIERGATALPEWRLLAEALFE